MKKVSAEELKTIVEKHGRWLRNEDGGERADLSRGGPGLGKVLTGLSGFPLSVRGVPRADC